MASFGWREHATPGYIRSHVAHDELKPGMSVNLVFEFSNETTPLVLQAPVASPLTPAPRGSAEIHEETESAGGH
jgi:hypothetical protein